MNRERIGKIIEAAIDEIAAHNLANLYGVVEAAKDRKAQFDTFYAHLDAVEADAIERADARYGKAK